MAKTRHAKRPDFDRRRRPRVFLVICSAAFLVGVTLSVPATLGERDPAAARKRMVAGQAAHAARAGLTEAVNWLRRQPGQPVVRFTPGAEDSIDPGIGLVREFPIADGLFGRFEVWRSETRADRLWTAGDPLDGHRRELGAQDVSAAAGYPAAGQVWRLHGVGFVFARGPGDGPFDRSSDRILHREVLRVDVTRFGVRLPGRAALCARDGSKVVVDRAGRVRGGSDAVGIYFGVADGDLRAPAVAADTVSGVTPLVPALAAKLYDDSIEAVFDVDRKTLFAMADGRITAAEEIPAELGPQSIYVAQVRHLELSSARPLRGGGVLYVQGNLTLAAGSTGSAADFNGLLYVDGDLRIETTATLRGAVIVTGAVTVRGGAGEARILYDDGVLRELRAAAGTYRISTPLGRRHERVHAQPLPATPTTPTTSTTPTTLTGRETK